MEEPHKPHQEPAWGWIGALTQARVPAHKASQATQAATHQHLLATDCAIPVARTARTAP